MPGEFSKASGRALWKTIKDKNTSPAGGSTRDERLAGWSFLLDAHAGHPTEPVAHAKGA